VKNKIFKRARGAEAAGSLGDDRRLVQETGQGGANRLPLLRRDTAGVAVLVPSGRLLSECAQRREPRCGGRHHLPTGHGVRHQHDGFHDV
jgi:hypothetical protein